MSATAEIDRRPDCVLFDYLADIAARTPDAPALLSDKECFTFAELLARAARYRNPS